MERVSEELLRREREKAALIIGTFRGWIWWALFLNKRRRMRDAVKKLSMQSHPQHHWQLHPSL